MSEIRRFLRTRSFAFALLLSVVLLVANIVVLPSFGSPSNFDTNLMLFAPFALVAMAATPAILSGGGGLDMSVGLNAGLVSNVLILYLLPARGVGERLGRRADRPRARRRDRARERALRRRAPLPAGHRDALHAVRPPGRQPEDRGRADGVAAELDAASRGRVRADPGRARADRRPGRRVDPAPAPAVPSRAALGRRQRRSRLLVRGRRDARADPRLHARGHSSPPSRASRSPRSSSPRTGTRASSTSSSPSRRSRSEGPRSAAAAGACSARSSGRRRSSSSRTS